MCSEHQHDCPENSRSLNRRRFGKGVLAAAAATQAGLFEFASTLFAQPAAPRPKAKVHVLVVRPKKHTNDITWPGGQVDIVAMQNEFTKTLVDAAASLDVQLDVRATPLATPEELNAYLKEIKAAPPQGILVLDMELKLSREIIEPLAQKRGNIPTIVYSNMSMFTGHEQPFRNVPNLVLAATPEVGWLKEAVRMFHAMVNMKNTRIAVVADAYREKKPWRIWKDGPEFQYLAEKRWDAEIRALDTTPEMRSVADFYARSAQQIVEPKAADVLKAVKVYVALRRLMKQENCQGITCNCLPFAQRTGDTACLAYSKMMDEGIVGCCEAATGSAMLMLLSHLLLERPGFIQDPSPNTVSNTLVASHCTAGLRLKGFNDPFRAPYLLRDYHIRSGVAVQVLWPVGEPVTVMQYGLDSMYVGTGRLVANHPNPPSKQWGGCRTTIEIRMDGVEDTRDVVGFHQMIVCGDFQRKLAMYGELTGIKVLPITKASRPKAGAALAGACACSCCDHLA